MQVRRLKQLLNTNYSIANSGDYLTIGSGYVPDMIKVHAKTQALTLSTTFTAHHPIQDILSKLKDIIASGVMQEILTNNDVIENPLPVFIVRDYEIIESVTDAYNYPNTDVNGYMLFDNMSFTTREAAMKWIIKEHIAGLQLLDGRLKRLQKDVNMLTELHVDYTTTLRKYWDEFQTSYLRWTTEPPTTAGWYWVYADPFHENWQKPIPAEITIRTNGDLKIETTTFVGNLTDYCASFPNVQWRKMDTPPIPKTTS